MRRKELKKKEREEEEERESKKEMKDRKKAIKQSIKQSRKHGNACLVVDDDAPVLLQDLVQGPQRVDDHVGILVPQQLVQPIQDRGIYS
jgi:hypothetical protein